MKICRKCNLKFNSTSWVCPKCNFEPKFISGYYLLSPEIDEDLGFQQESFEELFYLEASNFWFRSRNRLIIWAIKNYFVSATKMLEIGCGTGYVLSGISSAFPHLSLTGSDISSVGLAYAAKRMSNSNVELIRFDAASIPFEEEFEIIGAFDVLEHIEDDGIALQQMYKATTKGGGIIITVPQYQFLWSKADELACHKRRYRAKELKKKVSSVGFNVIRITSFVSFLFPAMVISRFVNNVRKREYDPLVELKLPTFINYSFEKILDFERVIIKPGVNFPFGGSLLLIARKV